MKARIYFTSRDMGGPSIVPVQYPTSTNKVRACIHLSLDFDLEEIDALTKKGWTIDALDDRIKALEQTLVAEAEAYWKAFGTLPVPKQKGTNT